MFPFSSTTINDAAARTPFRRLPWKKPLLAAASGLLLTASFPPLSLPWLAWIALVPLLVGSKGSGFRQAFKLGFAAGMVHYLTLLYWIVVVLGHYGGLNVAVSVVPLLLLCGVMALYPALFAALTAEFNRPVPTVLFGAFAWVGLEYVRTFFMTGFPWCLLGYSQYRELHVIQIADLFGVYGVSFLIVLTNGLGCSLWTCWVERKGPRLPGWHVTLTAACVLSALVYGHLRLNQTGPPHTTAGTLTCSLVQGNIDQSVKWDPAYQDRTLSVYERLTQEAARFHPRLVVWPETAIPFFFQDSEAFAERIVSLADSLNAALLFGSPAYERVDGEVHYFNRAYLVDPATRSIRYYDKVHLVPFGEYVPLKRILFFIQHLVPAAGDFASGKQVSPLPLGDLSIGVLICFEAIFPDLARRQCELGADILVNLTNDAWFGKTSAPYQHLCMAAFRAVENRRPLLRAANTGISAVVRPTGKIEARSPLFQEALLTSAVRLATFERPFYTRFGDLFARLALLVAAVGCVYALWPRRRST